MDCYRLLVNIQQQKPVNFAQVVKKLPKTVNWQTLFSTELVAKDKHLVTILDPFAFKRLLDNCQPALTRAQAASHAYESSHNVKCESAYMLCFPAITSQSQSDMKAERSLSAIAIMQNKHLHLPFVKRASHAILIENQDCFFQWQRLLAHYQQSVDIKESDIYFSAGSRILNPAFNELLANYQVIQCLFDYDLAGLQTATALAQRQQAKTQYMLPDKLVELQSLFTFAPHASKDLIAMIALCNKQGIPQLASLIAKQKRFMEQEALLTID